MVSFFISDKKLLRKTGVGSKTVKVYDKALKTPCQRLMESSLTEKAGLSARRGHCGTRSNCRIPLTRPSTAFWLPAGLKLPFLNALPKRFRLLFETSYYGPGAVMAKCPNFQNSEVLHSIASS
jgi:hypothetical protein